MLVDPLAAPLALAGLVMVVGAVSLYVYREFDFYGSEAGRTSDSDSLRGKSGRVVETVTTTDGRIKLDGGGFNPYYQARSMEGTIEEGEEVMVVDPGGGNVVTVESMNALSRDEIDRALDREAAASDMRETTDETSGSGTPPGGAGSSQSADAGTDGESASDRERERDPN